jgi:hypothetical protein
MIYEMKKEMLMKKNNVNCYTGPSSKATRPPAARKTGITIESQTQEIQIYRVIQEETSTFWEVIVWSLCESSYEHVSNSEWLSR